MEIAVVVVLFALLVEKTADSIYENHRAAVWFIVIVTTVLTLGLLSAAYNKILLLPILLLLRS